MPGIENRLFRTSPHPSETPAFGGVRLLAAAFLLAGSACFAQKLGISGCTATHAVTGYPCTRAYDNNQSTEYRSYAPGVTQTITLSLGSRKRIKRVVVNWGAVPNGIRDYFTLDESGAKRWIGSINGSSTTDDLLMSWDAGSGSLQDTMPVTATFIIDISGSNTSGIREISLFGPGLYKDDQILTRTIPFGPWNMDYNNGGDWTKFIPIVPAFDANRVVGVSAVILDDNNGVHKVNKFPSTSIPRFGFGGTYLPTGWFLIPDGASIYSGGLFANTNFNDPNKNPRGYLTIQYLSQNPDYP